VHIKGVALSQAGEARGALGAFQRAGELKPTLSNAHSNAGNMLRELGEHREAAKAYRAALKLDPSQALWWTSLCNSLNACDESDEAAVAATEGWPLSGPSTLRRCTTSASLRSSRWGARTRLWTTSRRSSRRRRSPSSRTRSGSSTP
jgi:predicted Zn-dependent protease